MLRVWVSLSKSTDRPSGVQATGEYAGAWDFGAGMDLPVVRFKM
jgi:hypothetical protein